MIKQEDGKTTTLAVKKNELRLQIQGNYIKAVSFSSNKVLEMKNNQLLESDQLNRYTALAVVHDKQTLLIPIIQGSWKYGGQKNQLLKVFLSPNLKLTKEAFNTWHLKKA